jgi:hypothetical protein
VIVDESDSGARLLRRRLDQLRTGSWITSTFAISPSIKLFSVSEMKCTSSIRMKVQASGLSGNVRKSHSQSRSALLAVAS